ncbi:hypothetical protein ACFFRR_009427 [Megaselia abdita]
MRNTFLFLTLWSLSWARPQQSGYNYNRPNIGTTSTGINTFQPQPQPTFQQPQSLIQKHIYVHVPPPDQDEIQPQRPAQSLGSSQKHYKIIFIKAPSPPSYQQQQIALQNQNEEKTIVYVLVKRPDDIGDVSIATPSPTPPSKPEVYFIKYKAQQGQSIGTQTPNIGGTVTSTSSGGYQNNRPSITFPQSTGGGIDGGISVGGGGIGNGGNQQPGSNVQPQYGVPAFKK